MSKFKLADNAVAIENNDIEFMYKTVLASIDDYEITEQSRHVLIKCLKDAYKTKNTQNMIMIDMQGQLMDLENRMYHDIHNSNSIYDCFSLRIDNAIEYTARALERIDKLGERITDIENRLNKITKEGDKNE